MDEQLESWKIVLDLTLRDYEHTANTWPASLREKGLAYVQLYTVSAGIIPIYFMAVFRYALRFGPIGFSGNVTNGGIAIALCIVTILIFGFSCYFIRNVVQLKIRNTFDSEGVIALLERKQVPSEELCIAAAKSLRGYIEENAEAWNELSKEIRRSYRLYYASLFAGVILYIFCILP